MPQEAKWPEKGNKPRCLVRPWWAALWENSFPQLYLFVLWKENWGFTTSSRKQTKVFPQTLTLILQRASLVKMRHWVHFYIAHTSHKCCNWRPTSTMLEKLMHCFAHCSPPPERTWQYPNSWLCLVVLSFISLNQKHAWLLDCYIKVPHRK